MKPVEEERSEIVVGLLDPSPRVVPVNAGTTRVRYRPASQLFWSTCGWSTNTTGVPFLTLVPSKMTSQFVSRTHPWDSALLTFEGLGVPWMPYPSAERPIQYNPTGLFGPGLMSNCFVDFTPLNLYSG